MVGSNPIYNGCSPGGYKFSDLASSARCLSPLRLDPTNRRSFYREEKEEEKEEEWKRAS